MKKQTTHKSLFLLLLSTLYCLDGLSQVSTTKLSQDPKFEQLLKEKRKLNQSITTSESYKIQIFYGNGEDSKKRLQEFKKEYKEIDGTIVYSNPSYKVWVGNYSTRIEVEKVFLQLKKRFPTALIIKPNN